MLISKLKAQKTNLPTTDAQTIKIAQTIKKTRSQKAFELSYAKTRSQKAFELSYAKTRSQKAFELSYA
jgi:hypothetical protein